MADDEDLAPDPEVDALLARTQRSDVDFATHPEIAQLIEFRLGRPSPSLEALEEHLARCADCRSALAELAQPAPPAAVRRARALLARSRRRPWIGSLSAAAAALVLVVIGLRWSDGGAGPAPEYGYVVETVGGGTTLKNAATSTAPPVFPPGVPVLAVVRPAQAVPVPTRLWIFSSHEGGGRHRVDADASRIERSPGGSFRAHVPHDVAFRDGPGQYTLTFIVSGGVDGCSRAAEAGAWGPVAVACREAVLWQERSVRVE